jgi:DNA-binding MarR family transcriptional regulator
MVFVYGLTCDRPKPEDLIPRKEDQRQRIVRLTAVGRRLWRTIGSVHLDLLTDRDPLPEFREKGQHYLQLWRQRQVTRRFAACPLA